MPIVCDTGTYETFQVGSSKSYPGWIHDAVSYGLVLVEHSLDDLKAPFHAATVLTIGGALRARLGDYLTRNQRGEIGVCLARDFDAAFKHK